MTCFSSVSIGFFAVVASTLDLLHLFPLIFLSVTFVMIVLAAILVRIPPLSRKPDTFVGEPVEEEQPEGNLFKQHYGSVQPGQKNLISYLKNCLVGC